MINVGKHEVSRFSWESKGTPPRTLHKALLLGRKNVALGGVGPLDSHDFC